MQKNPRRGASLRGFNLCLLALAVPFKPLAYAVADYACYERHKELGQNVHGIHPLSVASLGKGSGDIIAEFYKIRKGKRGALSAIESAPLFVF